MIDPSIQASSKLWQHIHWLDVMGMEETSDIVFENIKYIGKVKREEETKV